MSPVDLILIEGFKQEGHPKLEVRRAAAETPPLHPADPTIIAIASDMVLPDATVPVVALDDIEAIADLLVRHAAPLESFATLERSA
jgi:molybdopterin-guanine dinucleotide biosynthesis protein B